MSTILAVDDEPFGREILSALLQPQGYRLLLAASGPDALAQAAATPPDLILLDVMMPGMDGFEVCRQLRANSLLREVPVIMLTALDDRVSRLRGIEAGADDFITKPFDRVELRARVRTITRLNRYRRLLAERARFEWMVEHADDGYLIVAETGTIAYANPRARLYLGLDPDGSLPDIVFLDLVGKQYHCNPPDDWITWVAQLDTRPSVPHYLVRPPSSNAEQFMLQADLLTMASYTAGGHVVRLRDITASVVSQSAVWSFQGLVRHKLSTALAQVLGSLRLLEGLDLMPSQNLAAEFFAIAMRGASQLQEKLQDIFRYMDTDMIHPELGRCQEVELLQIASALCADLELPSACIGYADGEHSGERWLGISQRGIELVLGELIDNACKFHPQQSPAIEVAISADADQIHITVSDDGQTLSPDQLAKAWLPYYQGERYFTGQLAGMGLGLSMVAALIWRIGGACRISNREPGPGVRVEISVPLVDPNDRRADELLIGAPAATLAAMRMES